MTKGDAVTIVAIVTAIFVAGSASAQVIEIGGDGAATVYDGPAVYSSEGVRALEPRPRIPSIAGEPDNLRSSIEAAAARHAVDPGVVRAVAWTESRFHQAAVSPKGAVGVMQLMDGTAKGLGVDRFDAEQNIEGGTAYLSQLLSRYRGSLPLALAAYNAGPGAVDRYGGVPPYRETQAYVRTILTWLGPAITTPVIQPDYPTVILIAP